MKLKLGSSIRYIINEKGSTLVLKKYYMAPVECHREVHTRWSGDLKRSEMQIARRFGALVLDHAPLFQAYLKHGSSLIIKDRLHGASVCSGTLYVLHCSANLKNRRNIDFYSPLNRTSEKAIILKIVLAYNYACKVFQYCTMLSKTFEDLCWAKIILKVVLELRNEVICFVSEIMNFDIL